MSRYSIEDCEFKFKCPRTWEQLSATDDDDKRYCGSCERVVHRCDHPMLIELHAKADHCVAVLDRASKAFEVGHASTVCLTSSLE
jgi:hypothetical protein